MSIINTRNFSAVVAVLFLACAGFLLFEQTRDRGMPAQASEPPRLPQAGFVTVRQQDIPQTNELPGRTTSALTSEVRPQVSGVVLKRLFNEGSDVAEGQQLYQIDPAPYKATYDSAVADLARGQAALETARAKETRYRKLIADRVISQQEYDDVLAVAKQAQADIASARSKIDMARINLEYTRVLSPISGRIGHSAVTPGALVTANQATPLTLVTSLDPIYVDLNQSVPMLLRLRKALEAGEIVQGNDATAKVTLKLEDGSVYPHEGRLQFSEVNVDKGTGTVLLRAIFPNPSHAILPGMYVHAVIKEGVSRNAIAVPQKAVSRNAQGESSVFVLTDEDVVDRRVVEVGSALADRWIVTAGLRQGERVLVDGLLNVRPGAKVQAVPADASQARGDQPARPDANS